MTPRRAVLVLEVAEPATWAAVRAAIDLDAHVLRWRDARTCEVGPGFRSVLPALAARGLAPLVVSERRLRADDPGAGLPAAELPVAARELLHRAQRHAVDGRFLPGHVTDPEREGDGLRALLGAGWIRVDPAEPAWLRLHPALPPPPPLAFDPTDALLPRPDDLGAPQPGPLQLLHDAASLAAAIRAVGPRRTLAGPLSKADEKRLATHLGVAGDVERSARWGRALRALEALRAVSVDPVTRELHLDLGLEEILQGEPADAVDALLRRLVEPDQRPLLELVRTTLAAAGGDAVDDVVFAELVREQQRTAAFWPWRRDGGAVYPEHPELPFDDDGFGRVEGRLLRDLLARLAKLGVVVTAPGAFAATEDGARWAGVAVAKPPPVWVTGDLEVVVPPDAVTPWERFQLERLGRCLGRDTVDRYRLERGLLLAWLETHDVEEALDWLQRRAPALPGGVRDTLRGWARAARRLVLREGGVSGEAEADEGG